MTKVITTMLCSVLASLCTITIHGAEQPAIRDEQNVVFELTPELFGGVSYRPGPFVVHLHCGNGGATGKLLTRDGIVVQGLDTDAGEIAAARRRPEYRQAYGSRLTFRTFDGRHIPFIDNCVNLIVVDARCEMQDAGEEILRVLCPRGVAVVRQADNEEWLSRIPNPVSRIANGFVMFTKPVPSDIDEWTHHMHGPDNNRVAKDTRLAPPLSHLQWTAGPRFTRHHEHMSSFQAMVSARGKVFYIIDEGRKDSVLLPPDWNLVARDAFNGIELWRKKLEHWFNHMWPFKSGPLVVTRRLVVKGDRLFAALEMGGGVSVLDANTGALLHELPGTDGAEEIIVEGGRLFVAQRQWLTEADKYHVKTKVTSGGTAARMTRNFSWNAVAGRQQVTAFDLATRQRLWQKETPVAPFGLGARNGNVYIFDGEQVLSLKADSGQVNWTSPKFSKARVPFSTGAGCNLVCGEQRILLGSAAGNSMVALSAKDGTIVWQATQYASGRHSPKDLFLIDGTAWTAATLGSSMTLPGVPSTANRKSGRTTGYNLDDGQIVADFFTESDVYIMNSRCHMSCATANYLITSRTGSELVSLQDKKWHLHHWVRGACLYGLMPANGILYAPPNPCACYTQSGLDGFNAVTGHDSDWPDLVEKQKGQDFVRGTACPEPVAKLAKSFGGQPKVLATSATAGKEEQKQSGNSERDAWPVYRHDNKRSGSTPAEVALPLAVRWRAEGYDNLTSLVVANGRCFFAEKDRHTVHCLDAKSGKTQWSYVAGGRIDSPPAIRGNSLYFGCADGWLYRLLVSTGELVWKRRIAPADLSLCDHGQPASVWPLSGGVLVQDGKVYCVAGRSSFLDGGMRLTVVDAESGEVLKENVMDHLDPENRKDMHQHVAMQNMPVALPDLLSSDGKHLYMRSQQFDLNGKRTHITNAGWDDTIKIGIGREHLFSPTGLLDDNWFHRTYWVYGNSFLEGCSMPSGGWFEMSRISPSGKMLCFDDTNVYGYGQFPEYSKWSTPLQYSLFSMDKKPKSYQPGTPDAELRKTRPNWRQYRTLRCPKVEFNYHWKSGVPVRAKAIVKTPGTLFVAGPEDILDEERVFQDARSEANQNLLRKQNELIDARKGGKLLAVSVRDGFIEQEIDLESQPVWDAVAAAYGNLFMCCKDGSVVAFNTSNDPSMVLKKKDFSVVNPEYFQYADRRFEHLIDAGIMPAIVGGWGRAVGLNAVGLPGYKRHYRNLIARYGAYPVVWILGGETQKSQGPWYALAEYVDATDPYDRLLTNHSSHLRHAFDNHAVFDFDMDATGHRSWQTANSAIARAKQTLAEFPVKPYVSGESCYERHMQENFDDLQRHQFWGLMLSGAAGHTYGAAGIWHMGVPEEHGNWGGWKHQPYDLTTWREGMHFPGSAQIGRGKALLEELSWHRFEPHPEWVAKENFAAGIPAQIRVIYIPKRGIYKWDGVTVQNLPSGSYSALYFDPVTGRRFDLGVVTASDSWKSPNVPSPQDWVLVMQAQKTGETATRPDVKVGEKCSGTLDPEGEVFSKKGGSEWLTLKPDGSYSGTPGDANTGRNSFLISVKEPGKAEALIQLTVNVIGAGGDKTDGRFQGAIDNLVIRKAVLSEVP